MRMSGLKILIFSAAGLQIRLNDGLPCEYMAGRTWVKRPLIYLCAHTLVTLMSPLSPYKKGANPLSQAVLSPCHPFIEKIFDRARASKIRFVGEFWINCQPSLRCLS